MFDVCLKCVLPDCKESSYFCLLPSVKKIHDKKRAYQKSWYLINRERILAEVALRYEKVNGPRLKNQRIVLRKQKEHEANVKAFKQIAEEYCINCKVFKSILKHGG